jgi:hypothetical protein
LKPENQKEKKGIRGHIQTHHQSKAIFYSKTNGKEKNPPSLEKPQIETEEG